MPEDLELQNDPDDPGPVPDEELPELQPVTTESRLATLEHYVRMQQRELNELQIEWQGVYDKFRALYARLNKRDRDDEAGARKVNDTQLNPAALALLNSRRAG